MYNSGTVGQRYIGVACHVECFLVLLRGCVCGALVERLVLFALEVGSFVCLQDLVCRFSFLCVCGALVERLVLFALEVGSFVCLQDLVCRFSFLRQSAQYGIKQRAGHIVGVAVCCLYFRVILVGVHTERQVGRKRPRRGGPCKDVCVLVFYFESYDRGTLFDVLVSLGNFLGGQRRTAARAVGHDLEALVEQALLPDLFERPPLGLDK